MIKIEKVEISGMRAAIRGMRNPKNSWDKSDRDFVQVDEDEWQYQLGENDLKLAQTLSNGDPNVMTSQELFDKINEEFVDPYIYIKDNNDVWDLIKKLMDALEDDGR